MQLTMTRTPSQRPIVALAMLALLMVALVATTLYVGSQRRVPTSPFGNGAVVYAEDGNLFIADQLDGPSRVLVRGGMDSDPVFSDQGDQIAFLRGGTDSVRIMSVRPNGTDLRELADLSGRARLLGWSPDGSSLLARAGGDPYQLVVIKSHGMEFRPLELDRTLFGGDAYWRPDGRHIAFLGRDEDPEWGIFMADADGTNAHRLARAPISEWSLRLEWSPDGKHLAFLERGGPSAFAINVADIDANGGLTDRRRLDIDAALSAETDPTWSPDGSQIAFAVGGASGQRAGIVNLDGSDLRLVGPDVSDTRTIDLTWAPDGRSLAIHEHPIGDPAAALGPWRTDWSVDLTTDEYTQVGNPVATWQRVTP